MKKAIAVFLSVITFLSLCSCGRKEESEGKFPQSTSYESEPTEKTDFSKAVEAKSENAIRYTESSLSMATGPFKNDSEMFEKSPIVIHGKVMKTDYLLKGSEVYTKSEVLVAESYKGNLEKGKVIKVREIGGFVPANVFENALSLEKTGKATSTEKTNQKIYDIRVKDNKVMEAGEDVLLFLCSVDYSDFDEFKTDSYQIVRVWQGKLLLNEKTGMFSPYLPKEELDYVDARSYTLDEFKNFVKECEKQAA